MFKQFEILLPHCNRGVYIITQLVLDSIENELPKQGMINLFLKHTSAAICITENTDSNVLLDLETMFTSLVPDGNPDFKHTQEGPDDMAAHVKSALVGVSLNIPIVDNILSLGIWQGICFCEFRNYAQRRKLLVTIWGE